MIFQPTNLNDMKNTLYISVFILFAAALAGCEKKYDWVNEYQQVDGSKAYLKVVHASPSFRLIHNMPDTFHVLVNDKKITSTILTYNSLFPFSVNATTNSITASYAAIEPGSNTVRLTYPGWNRPDSLTAFTLTKQFTAGVFYTLMVTDSLKSTLDSSQIFVRDPFAELQPLTGFINIRLIHAVVNDTAGTTINVSSYARNANLFTNVKPKTTTVFSRITINPGVVDTFYVRRYVAGGAPNTGLILAKIPFNSLLAGGGSMDRRSYTLYYKGNGDLTTGAKARSLSAYIND